MHRSFIAGHLALTCVLAISGCAGSVTTRTTPANLSVAGDGHPVILLTEANKVPTNDKADSRIVREDGDVVFQVDIYQLTVPYGAISANGRFWKHVDEDNLDLANHTLLLNNGIRYGIGANDEWTYFKSLIDEYSATAQKGSLAPSHKGKTEMPMSTNIREQTLFFYTDPHKVPAGRTYEKCDNMLVVSYEPTPRHPTEARIEVCALIRGLRMQYTVTVLNDVREIEFKSPEYLYDLRLRQDVPKDHFLVLAPSKNAELPDTLGHVLFVHPGAAEPMETVILLVPRPFKVQRSSVGKNGESSGR